MNPYDFEKHFEAAAANILGQIRELPNNLRISRVVVQDDSKFVKVSDDKKEWVSGLIATASVKMDLRCTTMSNGGKTTASTL